MIIIASGDGSVPTRHRAITWTNVDLWMIPSKTQQNEFGINVKMILFVKYKEIFFINWQLFRLHWVKSLMDAICS